MLFQGCYEDDKFQKSIKIHFRAYKYAPAEISAFDKIMDQHKSTIRLNYYPKMSETKKTSPIDGSFLACPEHYDSGLLTILSQDMVGGLQGMK